MSAAQNIVDFVRGFGERKRAGQIREQMGNYLTNPEATITAVNDLDPYAAIGLTNQRRAEQQAAVAAQKANTETQAAAFERVTKYLRPLAPEQRANALGSLSPFLKGTLGASDADIAQWGTAIAANPAIVDALDDDLNKERAKAQYGVNVLTPGSKLAIGGKEVLSAPYKPESKLVRRGDGGTDVVMLDPNAAGYAAGGATAGAPGAGPAIPLTVEALRPHFVAQESAGNYTARNAETGAMGRYQVMPETGAALAKRLGLAWRPDMMTADTPQARRYQDAIGDAAIQEAIDNGNGDPRQVASYYYGGSNRKNWGPKTRQYADEMMTRFGGGQTSRSAAPAAGAVYSTPGKAPKSVRAATAEEISAAGYPAGTAAQIDETGKLVNLKTPPAGAQGAKSPAAQYEATVNRTAALSDMLTDLRKQAEALRDNPDLPSYTGNLQGRLPSWLGQGRNDFNLGVETLKTKVGLNALQTMREMSKTGGALGQVSNYENRMLQNSLANLDTSQSEAEFKKNLNEVIRVTNRSQRRLADALRRTPGAPGREAAAPAGPAVGTIARNPKTGARVRFNGQGWEPVR